MCSLEATSECPAFNDKKLIAVKIFSIYIAVHDYQQYPFKGDVQLASQSFAGPLGQQ